MNPLELNAQKISDLCKTHNVTSLYSFGSVNSKKFSATSDIDLVVDIGLDDPLEYTEAYFDLKFKLQEILNRSIDLLELKAIKNPVLQQSIDKSKILVYRKGN